MNFKEWVSGSTAASLQSLKTAVDQTRRMFDTLLRMFVLNEAARHVSMTAEHYVLPSKEFQAYFKPYGQLKQQGRWYVKSCGQDGCAYFTDTDNVVKFSSDYKEFKIANAVKGNVKILPILDAVEWEIEDHDEFLCSVVMKKVNTDAVSYAVREAADTVAATCHRLQILVSKKPHTPEEYVRRRLSLAYMLRHTERKTPEVVAALKDFVRVLRLIYEKSGIIVGADWENGRNFGMSRKMRVQPFDFGRGDRHVSREEPPATPIQIKKPGLS